MLLDRSNPVLRSVIRKCDAAFRAGTPLIFLDTQEREVALSTAVCARDGELVDLTEKASFPGKRELAYYEFVGSPPEGLGRYSNLFFEAKDLNREEGDRPMGGGGQPFAAVIHLTGGSQDTLQQLRKYIRRRLELTDTSAPLANSLVLLYGDPSLIAADLQPYTAVVSVRYPTQAEICAQLMEAAEREGASFESPEDAVPLAVELTGFTVMEVERMADKLLKAPRVDGRLPIHHPKARIRLAREEKKQALMRHQGILELEEDGESTEDGADEKGAAAADRLQGMGSYKDWAEKQGKHMHDVSGYALRYGITPPKGVLLCGVPGCGKSEAAKILRYDWKLSMVRLNVDALMGSKVGESERNMREALRQAEAMAPCILLIDELEKAFSGSSSRAGDGDGGTFKRMFGRLLTWMQTNKKPVFIIATANDIDGLPKEFFRSGRFDALFSVFMPSANECCQIFEEHMYRADGVRKKEAKKRNVSTVDLFEKECYSSDTLNAIMRRFVDGVDVENPKGVKFVSGADIAKITHMALFYASERNWCTESRSIKWDEWSEAVSSVLQDNTLVTQGGTEAGLCDIAAVTMRLIRGNFVPASSPKDVIFSKRNVLFTEEKGGRVCKVIKDSSLAASENTQEQSKSERPWSYSTAHIYDKALFNALKPHLERIGSRMLRTDESI